MQLNCPLLIITVQVTLCLGQSTQAGSTSIGSDDAKSPYYILSPGQKWYNRQDDVLITIEKVNTKNATFSARYNIIRKPDTDIFPIIGEFDPTGVSIGWTVSYWNKYKNDHALGVWAGYFDRNGEGGKVSIATTRLITHSGDSADVTVGFGRFTLEE